MADVPVRDNDKTLRSLQLKILANLPLTLQSLEESVGSYSELLPVISLRQRRCLNP